MKYVRLLLFTFILLGTEMAEAQFWMKEFRAQGRCEDYAGKQVVDSLGNIYLTGSSQTDKGLSKILVIKTNLLGDTLWSNYYLKPSSTDQGPIDMQLGTDGNLYITGYSFSRLDQSFSIVTLKLDTGGSYIWGVTYRSPNSLPTNDFYPNQILVDDLYNVYVSGSNHFNEGFIIKYDSSGQLLWEMDDLGHVGDTDVDDMKLSNMGHLTVCGNFYSNSNFKFIYYVNQYSPDTTLLWSDTIHGSAHASARKMKFLNDGQLIVSGYTSDTSNGNVYMAVKYDTLGNRLWTCKTLNNGTNMANLGKLDMAVDDTGNVYIAGYDQIFNGKAILSRINYDGTQSWRRDWDVQGGNGDEVFNKIVLDTSGGVYVTGWGIFPGPNYENTGGIPNQIVVKYTSSGDSLWTRRPKDTLRVSRGWQLDIFNDRIIASGTSADIEDRNPDFFINSIDTSGVALPEWKYNGEGDVQVDKSIIVYDANNNIYIAATIDRYGYEGKDVVILKYDPLGNVIWNKYYSSIGTNNDTLTCFNIDSVGNLVMLISSDSLQTRTRNNLSIVRMDVQGNFLDTTWITISPFDNVMAVMNYCLPNGQYIIGANSKNLGGVVFRIDTAGTMIWLTRVDTSALVVSFINKMIQCDNGEIGLAGYTQQGSTSTRIGIVQKISASGVKLWYTMVDSLNARDEFLDLSEHSDGKFAVNGYCGNSYTLGLICKLEGQNGSLIWRKVYNAPSNPESGRHVGFLSNGNIVITNEVVIPLSSYPDLHVVMFDTAGSVLWINTLVDSRAMELFISEDDLIAVGGERRSDLRFFGLDSIGSFVFNNIYSLFGNIEYFSDLNRDYANNYCITGIKTVRITGGLDLWSTSRIMIIKYPGVFVGLNEVAGVKYTDIYAYPNPSSNGRFTLVDASGKSPISRGRVFDSSGKLISSFNQLTEEIDLSTFPTGLYLLQYDRNNLPAGTVKLMVE